MNFFETLLDYDASKKSTKISAEIICETDRHKQIIIGKGGLMLKKIGTSAREEIEKLTGTSVMLELFVKVKPGWKENKNLLSELGYNIKEID